MDGVKRIKRGRGLRCSDVASSVWADMENKQMWPHKKTKLEEKRTAGWDKILAGSVFTAYKYFGIHGCE